MNSKYFRTVSIIMIIFGVIGTASGIATLSSATVGVASVIISLITNILLIVAGVIGTKAVKTGDDEKTALCKKLSYALLAITVIGIIVGMIGTAGVSVPGINPGMVMGMTVIGSLVSLILPVLYFFGAKKMGE